MSFDLDQLRDAVARYGRVARIVVTKHAGSVPRGTGTAMLVWADSQDGTIGGGALELQATQKARALLAKGGMRRDKLALGPSLGQCCGGAMTLVTEVFEPANLPDTLPFARRIMGGMITPKIAQKIAELPPHFTPIEMDHWIIEGPLAAKRPLWIYGAGHVGRALVDILAPLPDVAVTWVDTDAQRFPIDLPDGVTPLVATDPARVVPLAPATADHLIMTYAHDMDLALCNAILSHKFASVGLIGSGTKWARFRTRLAALGHGPAQIDRIACPIGDPTLGKHPQALAIGVASRFLGARAVIMEKEHTA